VQSALDALSAHVAILDADGVIIGVNKAWRRFADANRYNDPNYGIGTNYLSVCDTAFQLNSPDAPRVAQGIRYVIAGKVDEFQLEYPCHSPSQKRWFVVRVSHFEWDNEVRVVVAHQNISELKHVQIELAESNYRLEAILDNINNAIVTIDSRGNIETANQATAHIFAYPLHQLIAMSVQELMLEPFDKQKANEGFSSEQGAELTGIRKDGSQFPIHFAMNKLNLRDGGIYTCIIRDISYRKRVESEIIERERIQIALEKERELRGLKNHFLSMMGHELNTPLTSINLSYDMLKKYRHLSTPEENEQALDNIQQQVEHLRDMVKDMMTLSRSEAEGIEVDPQEVDLITYCRDVVEEFQFGYHKTHQVMFECEAQDIRAQIDRRSLRRVFTNLLSNAIKYSPEGGVILFQVIHRPEADEAIIKVSDSGIGVPEEDMPRLFEAFHRATNAAALPGTGLGLAIVKQIIELHYGTVSFESEVGKGTSFTIHLPLHQK
jgi:PAS domain S-box-containing protein